MSKWRRHGVLPDGVGPGDITPKHVFEGRKISGRQQSRRELLLRSAQIAVLAGGLALPSGCRSRKQREADEEAANEKALEVIRRQNAKTPGDGLPLFERYADLVQPGYPAPRSDAFGLDRALTEEAVAGAHNNFYEFTTRKSRVWREVGAFEPRPWSVVVDGMVHAPKTFDLDAIAKFGLEERLHRFRCVEAWAMAVPWTGVPFRSLVDVVRPMSSARYVQLTSFSREDQAPLQRRESGWPWPYTEAFTIDEVAHPLAFLATGVYGHALPRQHGAPVRLVMPWKYGFKNIKSITRITFTEERPTSFWRKLAPKEYGFSGNVNPKVAHPRWSQTKERMIGTGAFFDTQWLNGYADVVGSLYGPQPIRPGWDRMTSPFFG